MAGNYNAGVETFLILYDHTYYDELNGQSDDWPVVEDFTLTPKGDEPPMTTMGRA